MNLPLFTGTGGAGVFPATDIGVVVCIDFRAAFSFAVGMDVGFALICSCKVCIAGGGVVVVVCVFTANDSPQPLSSVMRVRNKRI